MRRVNTNAERVNDGAMEQVIRQVSEQQVEREERTTEERVVHGVRHPSSASARIAITKKKNRRKLHGREERDARGERPGFKHRQREADGSAETSVLKSQLPRQPRPTDSCFKRESIPGGNRPREVRGETQPKISHVPCRK